MWARRLVAPKGVSSQMHCCALRVFRLNTLEMSDKTKSQIWFYGVIDAVLFVLLYLRMRKENDLDSACAGSRILLRIT